jgi:hypothetical protein
MSAALLAPDFLGVQSLILYYARKKLYHHVSVVATQALQKRANDPAMLFWRAYATPNAKRCPAAHAHLPQAGAQRRQIPGPRGAAAD